MPTLQTNDSGDWRELFKLSDRQREEIHALSDEQWDELLASAEAIAETLRERAKRSVPHVDCRHEWLRDFGTEYPWRPITSEQPEKLVDVLASVYVEGDAEPETLMIYRKETGSDVFYLSGTADQVIRGAYAFTEVIRPARRVAA
jgi:hypothetical protein